MGMSVTLYTSLSRPDDPAITSPLPTLLQTPSGLALLELQGTINLPEHDHEGTNISTGSNGRVPARGSPIGRLVFPEYESNDPSNTAWMKRVYLYVGKHQRLTGQVRKLHNAIAVIRKRAVGTLPQTNRDEMEGVEEAHTDELEIVEIVKYKILFSTRPEPVGSLAVQD